MTKPAQVDIRIVVDVAGEQWDIADFHHELPRFASLLIDKHHIPGHLVVVVDDAVVAEIDDEIDATIYRLCLGGVIELADTGRASIDNWMYQGRFELLIEGDRLLVTNDFFDDLDVPTLAFCEAMVRAGEQYLELVGRSELAPAFDNVRRIAIEQAARARAALEQLRPTPTFWTEQFVPHVERSLAAFRFRKVEAVDDDMIEVQLAHRKLQYHFEARAQTYEGVNLLLDDEVYYLPLIFDLRNPDHRSVWVGIDRLAGHERIIARIDITGFLMTTLADDILRGSRRFIDDYRQLDAEHRRFNQHLLASPQGSKASELLFGGPEQWKDLLAARREFLSS